jgi:hypothetical protein
MASPQSPNTMSLNLKNLTTVIAVGILVGTEVFAVALAAGWAIAGLFELGDTVALILMGRHLDHDQIRPPGFKRRALAELMLAGQA